MIITILTDNKSSWFIKYGKILLKNLQIAGHNVLYVFDKNDINTGDICFILSCTKIIDKIYLDRNKHNIVIHASDLPSGKGFSPLQWQILEGKNEIVLTLFEAVEGVDAGPYYLKDKVKFLGIELHDELRQLLAEKIIDMSMSFVNNFNLMKPIIQQGTETFYARRTRKEDKIDINKSIIELFNHFRIANNEQFPLYFEIENQKYSIKVEKLIENDEY